MEPYEEFEYKDHDVTIYYDEDPMNPRTDYDHLATMACFHNRYNLGDKWEEFKDPAEFINSLITEFEDSPQIEDDWSWGLSSKEFIDKYLERLEKYIFILPIYAYEHGGITISTGGFNCPFDSGQCGWIYTSKKQVREEWEVKRISPKLRERIYGTLKSEVEEYDNYLTGQVYGYRVTTKELECDCGSVLFDDTDDGCIKCVRCGYEAHEDDFENEEVDSCWGFFGDPEKYMIPEIKSMIDHRCHI